MASVKSRACARCGVAISEASVMCRDCREADPVYVRLTKPVPPRIRRASIGINTRPQRERP